MSKSMKDKVISRIYGRGRGWAFSANDFLADFKRDDIDKAFSFLAQEQKIRRVIRGIYDYPIYSEILKKYVAPDIEQVAYALARKFSWRIQPTGDTALNYLGLSTQVVGKSIYLSDGPSKKYDIDGQIIEFKNTVLKEAALKNPISALIVQALKAMGENNLSADFLNKLKDKYSLEEWRKIKSDTSNVTGWVYKNISNMVSELEGDK